MTVAEQPPCPEPPAPLGARLSIERLCAGGQGLARCADGRIAFVSGVAPGDEIIATRVAIHRRQLHVTSWELVQPGPDRVTPPCPHQHVCGGCDWMHLFWPGQLRSKAELVREAFRRTGGMLLPEPLPVVTAGSALGYRGRARVHVDAAGQVGFFASGSHAVIPFEACLVCSPALNDALAFARRSALAASGENPLRAFHSIEVAAPPGERASVRFWPRVRGPLAAEIRQWLDDLARTLDVTLREDPDAPTHDQAWPLGTFTLYVPAGAFGQVNWEVNLSLVEAVVEGARVRGARTFLDLYCGSGNFSVPLAVEGLRGTGVEWSRSAVRAARRSVAELGPEVSGRVQFVAGDVESVLARDGARLREPDLLLLDPPREGAKGAIPLILALRPRAIALIACDPVTCARDCKTLVSGGYRVERAVAFDLFPQTHHVETLVWLTRP